MDDASVSQYVGFHPPVFMHIFDQKKRHKTKTLTGNARYLEKKKMEKNKYNTAKQLLPLAKAENNGVSVKPKHNKVQQ